MAPGAASHSDPEYLFLQLGVEEPTVSDEQNCGNILAAFPSSGVPMSIEHPTGRLDVQVELDTAAARPTIHRSSIVRTARKLSDGTVFARPASLRPGSQS